MGTVLDTTVFIDLERALSGRPGDTMAEVASRLESELGAGEDVGMAAITASDLLHGVHRATPRHQGRREAFVEAVIVAFPPLSFDLICARALARLWAELVSAGKNVGAHNRLVAATAIAIGWRVGTANVRHFEPIAGLDVVEVRLC